MLSKCRIRSGIVSLIICSVFGVAGCSDGNSTAPNTHDLPHVDVMTRAASDHSADVSNRIAAATNEFIYDFARNESTRGLLHASKTNECVAAVQTILLRAGLGYAGPTDRAGDPEVNVDAFRAALAKDRRTWLRYDAKLAKKRALPGDIWVQGDGHRGARSGQNHVGICQDAGCAHVVSNSSEKGAFTWSDSIAGYEAVYRARRLPPYPGAVYHHT